MSEEIIVNGEKLDAEIFQGSLAQNLIPNLKSHPKDNIIQVNGETGETQTSYDLLKSGLQVAEGLKILGVKEEDVVALVGNYSSRIFAAALAGISLGAPIFPIDPSYKTLEFKHMFNLCDPKVVFCEKDRADYVVEALDLLGNQAKVIVLYGEDEVKNPRVLKFSSILKDVDVENYQPLGVKNPKEQVILIVGSSGTTGFPKAVAATHRNMNFQLALCSGAPEIMEKQSYLQVTHIFWVTGIFAFLWSCLCGIKRVYVGNVNAGNLLNAIHKYKPEWVFMPPIHLSWMLSHPDFHKYDVTSLKHISCGGSPLQAATIKLMKDKWPKSIKFTQGYGMTEMTGATSIPSTKDILSAGILQKAHQLKIVDVETGKTLGPNQPGEIRFKSQHGLMKGYLKNEKDTKDAFDETGFYKSGDVGYYTEDKHIYVINRIKELIKCKNHQISPVELENVISLLPEVQDVGVVGVPHEVDQYRPTALVVKKKDAKITEEAIVKFVADNLSEHKQLYGGVKFVDSIPRTHNGKIKRAKLKELL